MQLPIDQSHCLIPLNHCPCNAYSLHAPLTTTVEFLLADAENCVPIPTPQYFGIDLDEFNRENADGAVVEYRSACVFVKRIAEKRRRIKGCFEKVKNMCLLLHTQAK